MIFPNEKKKELWRYASKNNPGACDGVPGPTQPPQPPPPPHRHRLQMLRGPSFGSSSFFCEETSLPMRQTPPPPYNSIPYATDCCGSYCQKNTNGSPYPNTNTNANNCRLPRPLLNYTQQLVPRADTLGSPSPTPAATEDSDFSYTKPGCSCVSSGDDMLIDENDQMHHQTSTSPRSVTSAMTFRTTAANMFRNCCGAGGHAAEASSGSTCWSRDHTIPFTKPSHPQRTTISWTTGATLTTPEMRNRKDFDALMKLLKPKQQSELLRAVKSRVDHPSKKSNINAVIATPPTFLQCILIKCTTSPADKEQHLTACRLFFWPSLRNGVELKRLPACPSARDCVYTCCNPLHWYRMIHFNDTESSLPPYQRSKMLRLKDADSEEEDSQNDGKSAAATWSVHSNSFSSSTFKRAESQFLVPSLESFTTEGKGDTVNTKGWCQIAYWEHSHRVGEFFHARKTTVNIYTDGIVDSGGDSMCLRELTSVGKGPHSEAVQNTRQKVGLGVTLSLESGDVWIYNRGNVPIFVDSPTLAEHLDRVCKVMPGYCLKAFETTRAQLLITKRSQNHPLGPIDRFSMKISFVKGWGHTYKRQDIMGCPCWLEVHFSHLR
ncbi:mothers against decapentaplegic homolog 6 isoform X2 [Drosophila obscura]|uniref:mothers against decapentaplegic homolog 6 isoform X2 n=1 Tax=Drosophila obscura TaxID=7282 RepID=UPI000BA0716E|nr:mothers against decapentaplegic homolog 6 isoform X2 [Drosophila obscura]